MGVQILYQTFGCFNINMRLPDFIRENSPLIISEWEGFAKTLAPAANMNRLQLRDHIEAILAFIAKDIESTQTSSEQVKKSHGKSDNPEESTDSAAETHGDVRHDEGFDIIEMISEYRALRSSIVKLWTKVQRVLSHEDVLDLTRFNESIDQALTESVARFVAKVDYSKDLLLGVLGHDIRSPLGAIKMSAQLMSRIGALNGKQADLAIQIDGCASRITDIVSNLLDLTRARQGIGLPIIKKPMDIGIVAQRLGDEMRIQYPDRTILLETAGYTEGEWDITRIGQLFSNLMGNALQYGSKNTPINVTVMGGAKEVIISVHNEGSPIPPTKLTTIFDPFTRGVADGNKATEASNLGLGLFISREIVFSHGGSIKAISNEKEGTTFTVRLPKVIKKFQESANLKLTAAPVS